MAAPLSTSPPSPRRLPLRPPRAERTGERQVIEAGRDTSLPARSTMPTPRGRGAMFPYYAFRAAEAMVRVVPHRLAYRIGAAAAEMGARTQPQRFEGLRGNLRRVLPDADAPAPEKGTRR